MNTEQLFDNKYKVIRILGQGGMSKVFLAENVKLDTLWAIKEIRKDKNQHVDLLAEPNALKKLRHPSLPRIFDIIENDDYIYIVQDYIEGQDVSDLMKNQQKIEEERVLKWAKQITDVFIYLHNMKPNPMIYRDMKPGNLIVDQEDNIKVIDFGIAREYKEGSTEDTTMLGTRGYASPEQYGTSQTDKRSDIYSLGITLYHMLTGIGPNDSAFDTRVLEQERNVSSGMVNVLKKCVENNPANRFQSAEELKDALDNVHQWNAEYQKLNQQKKIYQVSAGVSCVLSLLCLATYTFTMKHAINNHLPIWSSLAGVLAGLALGIVAWQLYQKLQVLSFDYEMNHATEGNSSEFKRFKKMNASTKPAMAFFSPRSTGKTELACNTALALSKMGKKVILLDLDHVSYGTVYNFPVDPGDDYENFYKFRILMKKVNSYIENRQSELTDDELKNLALYQQKNLIIYSGNQEIELSESIHEIERHYTKNIEPELLKSDLPKEWLKRIKSYHLRDELKVSAPSVEYLVRKLIKQCDVLIIDVGRSTSDAIKNLLIRSEHIEKYLVTTENIEDLNCTAHLMQLEHDIDYEGWNLLVNKIGDKPLFNMRELKQYFHDGHIDFLRFKIKSVTHIPYVDDIWKFKRKRKCIIGFNEQFDQSIISLIHTSVI